MAWLLSLPRCQFISAVHLTFGEGTFSCPFSRGRWLFLSIPPSQAEDLYLPSRNGTVCFPLPSGLRISFVREESLVNRLGFMCVRHTGFSFSVLLLCLQFFFCELSDRNLLYKGFPIILNSQINSRMVLNFFFFFTILAFLKIQFLWQLPLPPHIMAEVSFMCLYLLKEDCHSGFLFMFPWNPSFYLDSTKIIIL